MRNKIIAGTFAAIALAASLTACSSNTSDMPKEDSSMSSSQSSEDSGMSSSGMTKSGMFEGMNEKMVSGMVEVSDTELKLTDFSSDEGPDLHVYLTNGTDEAAVSAGMMIDKVSFDTAEQTFMLDGVDVSKYTDVVIHCDKAKAVFGAAKLS